MCAFFWSVYSWADSRDRLPALFDYSSVYLILSRMDFDTHSINIAIFIDTISTAINNSSGLAYLSISLQSAILGLLFLTWYLRNRLLDQTTMVTSWCAGIAGKKKLPCQNTQDYCFVYDFTKQTSLYLFETKLSHQSTVSISHLTCAPKTCNHSSCFFSPHPPIVQEWVWNMKLQYIKQRIKTPKIQNGWVKISVLEVTCIIADGWPTCELFDHYTEAKSKHILSCLTDHISCNNNPISRPWIVCS